MNPIITTPAQFMDLGQALAYLTARNKPSATILTLESCQNVVAVNVGPSSPIPAPGETDTLSRETRMAQFGEGEL